VDGTIFLVTRAHLADRASYLTSLAPDLTPRWSAPMHNLFQDGCGVNVALDGNDTDKKRHCRPGATMGVDPATNDAPSARAIDSSSSSPVALPDGGVLYGSYSNYNGARGHLLKFDQAGALAASFDFGWDTTPAVWMHGDTYSIVIKDNHYFGIG